MCLLLPFISTHSPAARTRSEVLCHIPDYSLKARRHATAGPNWTTEYDLWRAQGLWISRGIECYSGLKTKNKLQQKKKRLSCCSLFHSKIKSHIMRFVSCWKTLHQSCGPHQCLLFRRPCYLHGKKYQYHIVRKERSLSADCHYCM